MYAPIKQRYDKKNNSATDVWAYHWDTKIPKGPCSNDYYSILKMDSVFQANGNHIEQHTDHSCDKCRSANKISGICSH